MPHQCAAPGCRSENSNCSMFSFPSDKQLNLKWRVNMNRADDNDRHRLWKNTKYSRLCQDHFTEDCFKISPRLASDIGYDLKRLGLKDDAVPTIFGHKKVKPASTRGAYEKRQKQEILRTLTSAGEKPETNPMLIKLRQRLNPEVKYAANEEISRKIYTNTYTNLNTLKLNCKAETSDTFQNLILVKRESDQKSDIQSRSDIPTNITTSLSHGTQHSTAVHTPIPQHLIKVEPVSDTSDLSDKSDKKSDFHSMADIPTFRRSLWSGTQHSNAVCTPAPKHSTVVHTPVPQQIVQVLHVPNTSGPNKGSDQKSDFHSRTNIPTNCTRSFLSGTQQSTAVCTPAPKHSTVVHTPVPQQLLQVLHVPNTSDPNKKSDLKSDIHSRMNIPTNVTRSLPEIQQSTAVCTPAPQHSMVVHTPVPQQLVQVLNVTKTSASFQESDQKGDIHSRTNIPTNCTTSLLHETKHSTAVRTPAPQGSMVVHTPVPQPSTTVHTPVPQPSMTVHTPVPQHLVQVLHVPITSASFEKSDLESDIHPRKGLLHETQQSTGTPAPQHFTVVHNPVPEHLVKVQNVPIISGPFEESDQKGDIHSRTNIPTSCTRSVLPETKHSTAVGTPASQGSTVAHNSVPQLLLERQHVPDISGSLESPNAESPDKHEAVDSGANTGSKFGGTRVVPPGSVNFHAIQGLPVNKPFCVQYFSTSLNTTLESKKYVIAELKDIPDTVVAPIKINIQGEIHEVKTDNLDEKYNQELNFGRLFNWVNISGALNESKEQPAPVIEQYPESQKEVHKVTKIDKPDLTETMEISESLTVKNAEKELNSVREEQDKLTKRCIVKVEKLDMNSLICRGQKECDSVNIQEFDDNGISSDLGGEKDVEANNSVEKNYGCTSGKQVVSDILADVPIDGTLSIINNGPAIPNIDSKASIGTEKVTDDSKTIYRALKDNCDLKASITTKKDSQDSKADDRTVMHSVYSQESSGTLKNSHYSKANNSTVKDDSVSNTNSGPAMHSDSHLSKANDLTVMHSVYKQENNGKVKDSHNSNANNRPVMINSLTQSNYRTLIKSHNSNDRTIMHSVYSQEHNGRAKNSHNSNAKNRPVLINSLTQSNYRTLIKNANSKIIDGKMMHLVYSQKKHGTVKVGHPKARIVKVRINYDPKTSNGTVKDGHDSKANNIPDMFNVFTQANMKILKNCQFSNAGSGIVMYSGTEEGSCDSNTNNGPVMCNVFTQANIGTLKDSQDSKANDGTVKDNFDSNADNGTTKESCDLNTNNRSTTDSSQAKKKGRKRKKPDIPEETDTKKLNEIFETVTFDDNSDPNILPRSSRLRSKGFKVNYAKLIVEGSSSEEDEEDGVKSGDETDNTNDDHDEDADDVASDDNVEDRSENTYDDTGLYEVGEDDMTENTLVEKGESGHKSQNKTNDIDEKRKKHVSGKRKGVKRKNRTDMDPDNKDPDFNPEEVKMKKKNLENANDSINTDNGGSSSESSSWYDTDDESEDEKKREMKLKRLKMKRLKQLNRIVVNLDEHEDKFFFDNRVSVRMMDRCIPESEKTVQVMVCAVCKQFNTEDKVQMEKHLENHLNRDFACNKCDYVGISWMDLHDHKSDTHKAYTGKDFKHACFICEEKFGTFRHYKAHMFTKHNLFPWICELCSTKDKPVMFEAMRCYKDHLKENHKHLLHPCASCGLLLLANQNHQCCSEKNAEKIPCDICGKLIRYSTLRTHKKSVHFKTRQHKCPHCDYTTHRNYNLKHHIHAKHEGFHKYKCDQCDFSCVRSFQLVSHKRTHSGHKPYKCDQCPYAAHWNVQLKTHKKLHGTPLGQECEKCHVVLRRGATFRKHMKNEHGTE